MDFRIRPLADRVVVKPQDKEERTRGGIFLPDTASKEKPQEGTVLDGGFVIEAAGDLLVSARIGLSETEEYPTPVLEQDGLEMRPSTGRPQAVSVYVTHDSVFYVAATSDHGEVEEGDEADEGDVSEISDKRDEGDVAPERMAELSRLADTQEQLPEGLPWLLPLEKPDA